ncbi:MAG: CoA transferase, partial [bacterium]
MFTITEPAGGSDPGGAHRERMREMTATNGTGALAPYRVVELPGADTALCGKMLADLGARVTKVEPPGGDPARLIAPLMPRAGGPVSYAWLAYNRGKSTVTLELDSAAGLAALRELLADADFLVESFAPGTLERMGLGMEALHGLNPGLIVLSVTPFGQTGPYAAFAATDIVAPATGGYLNMIGEKGREPLRIGLPQSFHQACGSAVTGGLIALFDRHRTGRGQRVDVSAQHVFLPTVAMPYTYWDLLQTRVGREGAFRTRGGHAPLRTVYPCRDGHVAWTAQAGTLGERSLRRLIARVTEEGFGSPVLETTDWSRDAFAEMSPEQVREAEGCFVAFFAGKTRRQMFAIANETGVMMAPVNTVADLCADIQLEARGFWETVAGESADLRFPGPPLRMSRTPLVQGALPPPAAQRAPAHPAHPARGGGGPPLQGGAHHLAAGLSAGVDAPKSGLPLEGVKVLDFGTAIVGPLATRAFSDFGATVIKVESATHPDQLRIIAPYKDQEAGLDRTGYFQTVNAGKMSLALNLRLPKAREIALRLAAWADVVVETYTPRVLKDWQLDYQAISRVNPDVIMLSHCLQGQTGPRADLRGFGQLSAALTGLFSVTGYAGEQPLGPYAAYPDWVACHFTTAALLAALDHRRRTGEGQYIDQAQMESALQFIAPAILQYGAEGVVAGLVGNGDPNMAPHGAFRCKGEDAWCVLAVRHEQDWRALCGLLGDAALADDRRLATLAGRTEHEAHVAARLNPGFAEREPREAMAALQKAGIPAGYVARPDELFSDPQLT